MKRFLPQAALIVALALPNVVLAQTALPGGATGPANPPAAAGPAPPAGPVPAEVMPPSARSATGVAVPHDSNFARSAAAGGLAEIRMGRLAEQKAESLQVRAFAQWIVADHMQLGHRLAAIAQQKGLTLPTRLDAQDASTMADLSRQSGANFDNAYLRTQVTDHEVALSVFQQEAEHGTDPDLKTFAQAALPTLRQHLRMARNAEKNSS